MHYTLVFVLALLACNGATGQGFECPDEFEGYYPHHISCDKYWECQDGIATLETCGNGLAFDDLDPTYTTNNCDYLHNVECGNRSQIEPPISAPNCPRLYGNFPDENDCSVFYQCRNGLANRFYCAPGLAYDSESRVCKWADQVKECKKTSVEDEDSNEIFSCPDNIPHGIFSKHPHPEDCRQYFVCISGIPREYGCPLGTVFKIGQDEFDGQCSDPEDVPECSNYYGDIDFDKEELVRAGVDPAAVGVEVASIPRQRVNRPIRPRPNNFFRDENEKTVEEEEEDLPPPPPPTQRPRSFRPSRPAPPRPSRPSPSRPSPPRPAPTRASPPRPAPSPIAPAVPAVPARPARPTPTRPRPRISVAEPTTPVPRATQPPPTTQAPRALSQTATTKPGLGQPSKVKAGDDYYYYYYYYDDEDEDQASA